MSYHNHTNSCVQTGSLVMLCIVAAPAPARLTSLITQAGGMGGMGGMGGGAPAQQQAQLPRDGRLAEAQALKAAGNKLHTEGSYEAASAKYNQARRAVTGVQEQHVTSSVTLGALSSAIATALGQRVMFLKWLTCSHL